MAIEFVGLEEALTTIPVPAGTQDGDLLLAWGLEVETAPSGWSLRGSHSPAGYDYNLWFRVADSEPPSYRFPNVFGAYSLIAVFRGVDASDPFATTTDSVVTGSGTFSVPGVTTMAPNSLLIGCNHDARMTTMDVVFEGQAFQLYSQAIAAAGATGARSASSYFGSIPHAYLTALRPASGDPPGPTAKPWWTAQVVE